FEPADLKSGAFAQFADVKTLGKYNTHRVSRDVSRALPADLLLYRQDSSFHSMVYVGESQFSTAGLRPACAVYHIGSQGTIRRLTIEELLRYPEPEWRPMPG